MALGLDIGDEDLRPEFYPIQRGNIRTTANDSWSWEPAAIRPRSVGQATDGRP